MKENITDFLTVHECHWQDEVNIKARYDKETYSEDNKKNILTTEEVKALAVALKKEVADCLENYILLQNGKDIHKKKLVMSYVALQKATLLRAVCYNKKRGTEVSEMLKQDFVRGKKDETNWSDNNELFNAMHEEEQLMAKQTLVLTVRGM